MKILDINGIPSENGHVYNGQTGKSNESSVKQLHRHICLRQPDSLAGTEYSFTMKTSPPTLEHKLQQTQLHKLHNQGSIQGRNLPQQPEQGRWPGHENLIFTLWRKSGSLLIRMRPTFILSLSPCLISHGSTIAYCTTQTIPTSLPICTHPFHCKAPSYTSQPIPLPPPPTWFPSGPY